VESFESSGVWWLPDSSNEKVVGLLRYSTTEGFSLTVPYGNLGGMKHWAARINQSENTPVALGVLQNGKHVTLLNLVMTNMTLIMPGAGSEKYHSSCGFVGATHVDSNLQTDKVRLAFTHLRDWVVNHPSALKRAVESEGNAQSFDYHYENPEPEELAKGDGWTLFLVHTFSIPYASLTGFNLIHDCELEIQFDRPMSFERMSTEFVGPLWKFLIFCLDRDINNTSLRIQHTASGEWMDVGRHQFALRTPDEVVSEPFMLLSRPQLGERVGQVLSSWLTLSDDERVAVALLTELISNRSMLRDLRFLVAAQALETLARVDAREFELKSGEFERRVSIATDSISDSKVRNWVARKLKYANERAGSELLNDLTSNIGGYVDKIAPDRKSLMKDIRANRNFYTHRDSRRVKRSLVGKRLYVLTQAVILLLKAATLRRLGFTEDETSSIMGECQSAIHWRSRTAKQYPFNSSSKSFRTELQGGVSEES